MIYRNGMESKVIQQCKVEKFINCLNRHNNTENFKRNKQVDLFSTCEKKQFCVLAVFVLQQYKAQKCKMCVRHGLSVLDSCFLKNTNINSYKLLNSFGTLHSASKEHFQMSKFVSASESKLPWAVQWE